MCFPFFQEYTVFHFLCRSFILFQKVRTSKTEKKTRWGLPLLVKVISKCREHYLKKAAKLQNGQKSNDMALN